MWSESAAEPQQKEVVSSNDSGLKKKKKNSSKKRPYSNISEWYIITDEAWQGKKKKLQKWVLDCKKREFSCKKLGADVWLIPSPDSEHTPRPVSWC